MAKRRFRVALEGVISTIVTVDAESEEEAEDLAPGEIDPGEVDWTKIEVVEEVAMES